MRFLLYGSGFLVLIFRKGVIVKAKFNYNSAVSYKDDTIYLL
jgi:hypothetical protein